ncbi:hypothetical protein RUND412_010381 [Rhizina undulata]
MFRHTAFIMYTLFKAIVTSVTTSYLSLWRVVDDPSTATQGSILQVGESVIDTPAGHLSTPPPPADSPVKQQVDEPRKRPEPLFPPLDPLELQLRRIQRRKNVWPGARKPGSIPWHWPYYVSSVPWRVEAKALEPTLLLVSTESTGKLSEAEEVQEPPSLPPRQQQPVVALQVILAPLVGQRRVSQSQVDIPVAYRKLPERHLRVLRGTFKVQTRAEEWGRHNDGPARTLIQSQLDLALKTGDLKTLRAFWPRQYPVKPWSSFAVPENPRKRRRHSLDTRRVLARDWGPFENHILPSSNGDCQRSVAAHETSPHPRNNPHLLQYSVGISLSPPLPVSSTGCNRGRGWGMTFAGGYVAS